VNGIAVAPSSPSTIFAATDSGLYKTTDGGANWAQSGSFSNVYAVIFDPQNPQTLYVSAAYAGIFKSTDGGGKWPAINSGFPNASGPAAKVLAIDPLNHSLIYATGRDGIFRSTNGGANWSEIDTGLIVRQGYWVSTFAIDPVTTSTLYTGLDSGGLYKSTDGGTSWTLTGLTLPTVSAIAIDPSSSGHVFTSANFNPWDAFITKLASQ
jgi:photosystem II stability/assembly factor-like uncharacterized protein